MTIKKLTFLIFALIGITFHLKAASAPLVRVLIIKGKVLDEDNNPVSFAEIETIFVQESYFNVIPTISKSTTDSLGEYQIKIKDYGKYKISFKSEGKITYSLSATFSRNEALLLATREYILPLNITLLTKRKNSKPDIYNGANLFFEIKNVSTKPYKRYIQLSDRKLKKGFKTSRKLAKYIFKQIKKQKLKKLVPRIATRPEIDSVINNKKYYPEIRKKWVNNFGKKSSDFDYDKNRIELLQMSYDKMIQTDNENELINQFKNYQLDLTKTVKQDDTKKVFNTYRYNFTNASNVPLAFDAILINTQNGWKVFTIYEVA